MTKRKDGTKHTLLDDIEILVRKSVKEANQRRVKQQKEDGTHTYYYPTALDRSRATQNAINFLNVKAKLKEQESTSAESEFDRAQREFHGRYHDSAGKGDTPESGTGPLPHH